MRSISCVLMLLALAVLSGCPSGTSSPSSSIQINPRSVELNVGQTTTFTATSPDGSDFFTWSSSDPGVATVDPSGRVAAVSAGTAQVTATSGRNAAQVTAEVTVTGAESENHFVTVSPRAATIAAGSSVTLEGSTTREDISFLWFSMDETVATVDANGQVTAMGPGSTEITVRGSSPEEKATATITVVEPVVHVTTVRPRGASILVGGTIPLRATSTDETDEFIWRTDAESTATVDGSGLVTGVGQGGVVITAEGTNSGARGTVVITVSRPVEHRVDISPSAVTIANGDRIRLAATSTRDGDTFTWSSDDETVVTVDSSGSIRGVGAGTARITASGSNPDERTEALVRVVEPAERMASVHPRQVSLPVGNTVLMSASSTDESESFAWSSSDSGVATVTTAGLVTGIASGEVEITAVGSRTGARGGAILSVTESVAHRLSVTPSAATIAVGDTTEFSAASTRAGDRIAWSSSDEAVAVVSDNGFVAGAGAGTTTITATGTDSGASAAAEVTVTDPVEQDVTVRPLSTTIAAGETTRLSANSTDGADAFTWTSSNNAIATVDARGVVSGLAAGNAMIAAEGTSSGMAGTATVNVTDPVVHDVRVSPASLAVAVGNAFRLEAASTRSGDIILWTSSDDRIATVDVSGNIIGVSPGTVTVTAEGSPSGATGAATVTVTEPEADEASVRPLGASILVGGTVTLSAASSNASDEFAWSTSDDAVATVDGSGVVTGTGAGSAVVTATGSVSGATGESSITVEAPVEHEVSVSPSAASIFADDSIQLAASTTRSDDTITWSSADESVAAVDGSGLVSGVSAGTVTITAQGTVANEQGMAEITVSELVTHTINLQPLGATIAVGEMVTLSATSTDPDDTFEWSSSNTSVLAVDALGVVTGTGTGTAEVRVRGTSTGIVATATIDVEEPAGHMVTVEPARRTIQIGRTVTLVATSTDGADAFTWSSANSSVADVDQNGVATAVAPGVVELTATGTSSGARGKATITVEEGIVHDVTVQPDAISVSMGESVSLTAESTDNEDSFSWSSSKTNVATVDAAGMVTGVATGTVEITATGTNSGASDSATVNVVLGEVHEISVLPGETEIFVGDPAQFTATSTSDADSFTWLTTDRDVATADSSGIVTGVGPGAITVMARGTSSGAEGTAKLTVAPHSIDVAPDSLALTTGETAELGASSTDGDDAFTWTSSDTAVATVSNTGTVTARGDGNALITATGTASGAAGSADVIIGDAEVTLDFSQRPLPIGGTDPFTAYSTDPRDTKFTWTSTNPDVAEVSDVGVVLGRAEGTTTIRAVGSMSNSAGLAEVTVVPAVTSLLLWDGERGFSGANGELNTPEAFRGGGCLEAQPTKFASSTVHFDGYPGERADISGFDEIWFFAKADMLGRTTDFRIRSFRGSSNTVNIDPYIEGGALDLEYRLVRIPIADLQTDNFALDVVGNIFFGAAKPEEGHKFFIDDVWAVKLDATDALNAPFVGSVQGVDFGDVALGESVDREVSLSNIGASPLTVLGFSVTGTNASEFSVPGGSFTIDPGESHRFPVTFSPQSVLAKATGDKHARVEIGHSLTPMGGATSVPLSGRALSPVIRVSESALEFGALPVGKTATHTFEVANPGNVPLTVSSIATTTSGVYAASPDSFELQPDETQTVNVIYAPLVAGDDSDVLTIASNATDMGTRTIALSATGVSASSTGALAVSPAAITSSTVTLEWPAVSGVDSIDVYLGPEPSVEPGGALPVQRHMETLDGSATSVTLDNLAPAVDLFFRVEMRGPGDLPQLAGNCHARTIGGPKAELDGVVREVHLVAPHILQVVVANLQVHGFTLRGDVNDGGIDEVVGDVGEALQAGPWSITRGDGTPLDISAIYRQSFPVGSPYYDTGPDNTGLHLNLLDVDHRLYFVLNEPVGNGAFLSVTGPEITRSVVSLFHEISEMTFQPSFLLPFSDKYLETPAIQLNQVGYSPVATERYAYVSAYMGDGGPMDFAGYPGYAAVYLDPEDPLEVRTPVGSAIPMTLRSAFDEDSGTPVREIDLSNVPPAEGVVYRVHIPGVGMSWPTQVSETAIFRAFYLTTRFMTHTRWGRVLSPDWTEWSPRPADHPSVYTSELSPEDFRFFPEDQPRVGKRLLAGGHHDAADFDINFAHTLHSLYLLRLYEMRPEVFTDGQLHIPESGNGIPDLLDEVLYNLRVWEQLQEADGGVRAGLESFGHPKSINYADLDTLPYWLYGREPFHTIRCAGLFAQVATVLESVDPAKAAEFEARAVAAFDYAMANGVSAFTKGPPMYASGELYRLTGESRYRQLYEDIWDEDNPYGLGPSVHPFDVWASSWFQEQQPILTDHVFGYLLSADPDSVRVEEMLGRFTGYAEDAVEAVQTMHAHRNGRHSSTPNWGRGTATGEFVKRIYARMQLGNLTPEDLQRYYNAISLSSDYALGGNPLGMVWISGLGSRRPMEPQHADSQTFVDNGFDPIPGITVYGPRSNLPASSTYDFGRPMFYPAFDDLPLLRRFADVVTWPATNEFTIQETQVPRIQMLGMLMAPGMAPPDTWLPGGAEHGNPLVPREDATTQP